MKTLNIIGTGRVGRVLGQLSRDSLSIGALYNRQFADSESAAGFIGAGRPWPALATLPVADVWLLAVPDDAIAEVAIALAHAGRVRAGDIVFHVSGASESALMAPLAAGGARLASVHPAMSFADPVRSLASFAGTLCALEGEESAVSELDAWVKAIGGRPFSLAPGGKAAYHAALSMAANYLVTLNALSMQMAAQAGINDEVAGELVGALMQQTLANVRALGAEAALTGPIVRGDSGTVARHLAVMSHDTLLATAYRAMGGATLRLAGERPAPKGRELLEQLLVRPHG